ncbi:hypothetical protein JCM10449v2_007126 [Rhodotorula kratochvilovae]
MPPRRSTRKRTAAAALDLTRSSPAPAPSSDLDNADARPAKRARITKAKGKAAAMEEQEEEGEDADEALARKLQEEEEEELAAEADGGAQPAAGPSTASSAGASTSGRRGASPRKRGEPSSSLAAPAPVDSSAAEADASDPKTVLREWREMLRGRGGVCGGCKTPVQEEEAETITLAPDTPLSTFLARTVATCAACSAKVCKGCWEPLNEEEGRGEGTCCAQGRAIAVYELPDQVLTPSLFPNTQLLASLDAVYLSDHLARPSAAAAATAAKKKRGGKKAAVPSGTGAGTGYGTGSTYALAHAYAYAGGGAPAGAGTGYAPDNYDDDEYGSGAEDDDDEAMYAEFGFGVGEDGADSEDEEAFAAAMESKWAERIKAAQAKRAAKAAEAAAANPSNAHDLAQDALFLPALRHLASVLPAPDAPTAQMYDFLPSPSLAALLALSTLPDLLATLLRNDAVGEWTRRADVYFAMLDVLGALGGCEALLGALFAQRREKKWSEGVGRWMRGEGDVRWERKPDAGAVAVVVEEPAKGKGKGKARALKKKKVAASEEEDKEGTGEVVLAASLYTLLKKLAVQAEAFRRAAMSGAFEDSDAALIGICGDFAAAGERFKALEGVWSARMLAEGGAPVANGSGAQAKGKGKGKEREWTRREYEKACEDLAYATVELGADAGGADGGKTFPSHRYNRDITAIATSRRPHNSFVHLAKELAVLSTSLPPGIWVRVDESRVDVLKCLIAGPEDSPYAGGLFEFDIFLPLQYPQVSPLCWLRTTGGGACRFNPNLYAEGKVCLSLLGTWSGAPEEMWQPGKSTLLQVLLSITSMILGTNYPFYNGKPQPGFGAPRDDERNKNYNKNCSLATTRWAILDWIQGDKFKDSIWADVIVSHFLLQRRTISSTLAQWAAADARLRAWTPSLNATCGTQNLEPYRHGAYGYNAYLPQAPLAAAAAAAGAKGKGKGKGKAAVQPKAKEPEQQPAVPAGPPPRDLVQETEEALDKLEEWREKGWLDGLVA